MIAGPANQMSDIAEVLRVSSVLDEPALSLRCP